MLISANWCLICRSLSQGIPFDDVCVFIKVVESVGIKGICHNNYETTCKVIQSIGFETNL